MTRNLQRLSQLIGTFGPGAMLDLPTRSVLVGGLERWEMGGNTFRLIEEPRLAEMLERKLRKDGLLAATQKLSLRTPPLDENGQKGKEPPGVHVTVFPMWFVCRAEGDESGDGRDVRRRRLVRWQDLSPSGGRRRYEFDTGKKVDVTPIRFVAACEDGHLQDVDWRTAVHGKTQCREQMWIEEKGTSADPRDTRVVCDCGKSLSLSEAFQPGRLGKCYGERPWLGDRDPNGCTHHLRLLTRTATNTYFFQKATVISLPSAEDQLSQIILAHFSHLAKAASGDEIAMARKFNAAIDAALAGYSDADVFSRVELLRTKTQADATLPAKLAEFDVFASGRPVIGENRPNALLFAETLPRERWDPEGADLCKGIRSLVVVHRLREVSCLYGFTRFEAAPTTSDDDLEDVQLAVRGAPLSRGADWLPAVEQFGEGLFLHVDPDAIEIWLARDPVKARTQHLLSGFETWSRRRSGLHAKHEGPVYTMLHSLSHALMAEIALDCGYPASAIKERIYAVQNPLNPIKIDRCGILLYTATSGNQGTLGGLVATASRFKTVLDSALRHLAICSNDPICADHDPTSSSDDRALHGAACHGCLLIAETSCEIRNTYLDRNLLVDTMTATGSAFFVA